MKNNRLRIFAVFASLLLTVSFVSCSKKAKTDENGFFNTFESAKKAAVENNQDILVVVTLAGSEDSSDDFIENILQSKSFKKQIATNYVIYYMDFGDKTYNKTQEDKDFAALMEKNILVASNLNVRSTPSFYLLSKEGYYITQLEDTEELKSTEQFKQVLNNAQPAVNDVHALITKIQSSTEKERLEAIDELVNMTDLTHKFFIYDLIKEVIKTDKNNEYGMIGKYLLYKVDLDATELFGKGEPGDSAKCYADVAQSPYLDADQKQQSYYMAAYTLFMGHVDDPKPILYYLQKAIDANPESPSAPQIRAQLESMTKTIAETEIATY